MCKTPLIACLSLIALAGCGTPSDGYYDANGNYVPYNRYHQENHDHAPLPGGARETPYTYDRAGYYDYNGYYVTSGPSIPPSMLPPKGMCRVWFTDRPVAEEPPIESCDGIHSRVPEGAYVIYGG